MENNEESKTKTILSWDVGIKNLAFCVIQKKDLDFKILKWGIINLNDGQQKCQFTLKTNNECQDVAKYCIYHKDKAPLFEGKENGILYACSKHKEKMMPECKPVSELVDIKDKKKSKKKPTESKSSSKPTIDLQSLICCQNCDEKPIMTLTNTNFCWCEKHYEKKGKTFVKKVASKKVSVTTCSKQPIQDLAEKLFERLDLEFKNFGEISEVLIENQPTLKNPKMKTISSILYSYFIVRGIVDREKSKSNITEVKFVSPSNKLKVNSKQTNLILESEKNKVNANVYKMTKTLGVKYCKSLISDEDNKKIDQVKKKDDMADSFLQGFQYLFSPVPEKYFEKLQKVGLDTENKTQTKSKSKSKSVKSDESDKSNKLKQCSDDIDISNSEDDKTSH